MITTKVSKIILSDEDSQALFEGVKVIESIYDAMLDIGLDATLTTSNGVDISTEDFHKYLEFLWDLKMCTPNSFVIDEVIKEM